MSILLFRNLTLELQQALQAHLLSHLANQVLEQLHLSIVHLSCLQDVKAWMHF